MTTDCTCRSFDCPICKTRMLAATGRFHSRIAEQFEKVGRKEDAETARRLADVCAKRSA